MDKKRKIIALIGILIGIGFLYLGFAGIKDERPVYNETPVDEPASAESADALGNIQ